MKRNLLIIITLIALIGCKKEEVSPAATPVGSSTTTIEKKNLVGDWKCDKVEEYVADTLSTTTLKNSDACHLLLRDDMTGVMGINYECMTILGTWGIGSNYITWTNSSVNQQYDVIELSSNKFVFDWIQDANKKTRVFLSR